MTPRLWSLAALITVGVLGGLGLVMVEGGWHKTASQQVVAEDIPVVYTVVLERVVNLNHKAMFAVGQQVALTVRNRPRGDVRVEAIKVIPKQVLVADDGSTKWLPDDNHPYEADVLITLSDKATQTKEGYVAKGVKIKAGMKVTLEDFDTYESGVIADVTTAAMPVAQGGSV